MRKVLRIRILAPLALFTLALAMLMAGCSNDQRGSVAGPDVQAAAPAEPQQFDKHGNGRGSHGAGYPQYGECTLYYSNVLHQYSNGRIIVGNGSQFVILSGSLTPPPGTPQGANVDITMLVEMDSLQNQLIFTFEPSGAQFMPPAMAWLHWQDLGPGAPHVYYIEENGTYTELVPEQINYMQQWLMIPIHHFSRYALARS